VRDSSSERSILVRRVGDLKVMVTSMYIYDLTVVENEGFVPLFTLRNVRIQDVPNAMRVLLNGEIEITES